MRIQDIIRARLPNVKLDILLRLAKTLPLTQPEAATELVMVALDRLMAHVAAVDAVLDARIRARNPQLLARELEFDRALDALWLLLRKLLELHAQAYGHRGLDFLPDEHKAKVELEHLREIAERATAIHEKLFGAEGTSFTRASFMSQAESMAGLLRVMEADGLDLEIGELIGEQFVPLLQVCQVQYEKIVSDRMSRDAGAVEDLRVHRHRLRWLIERYKAAVETLYDEAAPDTEAIVFTALKPLLQLDAHVSRSPSDTLSPELDAELVANEFELPEAEAEAEPEAGQDIQAP